MQSNSGKFPAIYSRVDSAKVNVVVNEHDLERLTMPERRKFSKRNRDKFVSKISKLKKNKIKVSAFVFFGYFRTWRNFKMGPITSNLISISTAHPF